LQDFYAAIDRLFANGGGDTPEFALDAILQALEYSFTDDYGDPLFLDFGSQIVVITDAPSKNSHLRPGIISNAQTDSQTCIHFFYSGSTLPSDYSAIASDTGGTVVYPYTSWSLGNFLTSYRENECWTIVSERDGRKKRQAATCQSFTISQFASLLKLSIQTSTSSTSVTITRTSPLSETITTVMSTRNLAVYSHDDPPYGQWSVCASSGLIDNIVVDESATLDATILFPNNYASSTPVTTPPPECKSHAGYCVYNN